MVRLDYIHNNPVKAGIVRLPEEYIYSSASNYPGRGGGKHSLKLNCYK